MEHTTQHHSVLVGLSERERRSVLEFSKSQINDREGGRGREPKEREREKRRREQQQNTNHCAAGCSWIFLVLHTHARTQALGKSRAQKAPIRGNHSGVSCLWWCILTHRMFHIPSIGFDNWLTEENPAKTRKSFSSILENTPKSGHRSNLSPGHVL